MITCRSDAEIERMRIANQLVAGVLAALEQAVEPGVTTFDLDQMAERLLRDAGAVPAFKGYRGYPATLCASINDEVVHGIPSKTRVLKRGDIISLDMGARIEGFYGDSAVTVPVGEIPEGTANLLRVTRESLENAIAQVQVGGRLSDVGHAVQQWVERHGFSVVREFVGHGIGEKLHEDPQIPNYGTPGRGPKLAAGMVLAIEPMVAMGKPETRVLGDGWTAVTRDGSLAAHFEHTVAVTPAGPLVLTARPVGAGTAASPAR
jgi:methionyl aminopeptidase